MKKFFIILLCACIYNIVYAVNPTDTTNLKEVSVVGLYRNKVNTGSLLKLDEIKTSNYGQEPSFVFAKMPSVVAYNDAGTNFGYSYFRIRGMDQARMNVTLDGMPWNESEDFGCYFSNSPDLMSSMHSIKVERGASVTNNGTAAYAGNVSLESANLQTDTLSYVDMGAGSFNTYRITGVYNMGIKKNWGLHIRGTMLETDGFKTHSYNSSQAFTIKTGYYFNDNHSIDFLSMSGQHRNEQSFMGITKDKFPKHINPFKQVENGCAPQETDNFFMTINKLSYNGRFSNNTYLNASVYYNHLLGDYRLYAPDINNDNKLWNYHLNQHMYGANVVAKFILNDFTVSTGVNAYMFQRRHIGTILPNDTIVKTNHGYGEKLYNNIGYKPDVNVFGSVSYNKNNWRFTGNVQYRYTTLNYNVDKKYIDTDVDFNHEWNFVNTGASVEYNTGNIGTVYGRYALTHREPSRVDMFGGEYYTGELFASTKAERVNDIEIGYDFHYKRWNVNINTFYMKFNNEMVATGVLSSQNGLPLHTQNNSYRTGVELSATYNPIKTWNIIFNGAWSSNKIKVNDENGYTHNNNNTYSPSVTCYLETNYMFKNKLTFGVSSNYRSSMYVDISNEHLLPTAFNLNMYVMKEWKHIDGSIHLNNITNKFNSSYGYVDDGTMYYLIDAPFNFYVNLRFKF